MTTLMLLQGIVNPVLPEVGQGDGNAILGNVIGAVVGIFLVGGFIFALLHMLFGAITWISASGDKAKLQNAQERITQAIVGLIVLAATWALMSLLFSFLGFGAQFPLFPIPTFSGNNLGGTGGSTTNTFNQEPVFNLGPGVQVQ